MEEIDINKLKQDLKDYYEAAYFTLGYGAALMDSFDLDNLSDEEVMNLEIETGNPICYELDDNLKPIKHYYIKK